MPDGFQASIIVPVHDEQSIILGFLRRLESERVVGDYEIIVACNACSDQTADLARTVEGVVVGETATPGKAAGLNLGDDLATVYPRIYVDVDVTVSKAALDAIVDELRSGATLAAAPRVEIDLRDRSWAVRSYYRVWMSLDWAKEDMVGSGIYAASSEGRARFGDFPCDVGLADDLFFSAHFAPSERKSLAGHEFSIPSSESIRAIIARKSRIITLNAHTTKYIGGLPGAPIPRGGGVRRILTKPALWPAALVYGPVAVVSRAAATRRLRRGEFTWTGTQRDVSS